MRFKIRSGPKKIPCWLKKSCSSASEYLRPRSSRCRCKVKLRLLSSHAVVRGGATGGRRPLNPQETMELSCREQVYGGLGSAGGIKCDDSIQFPINGSMKRLAPASCSRSSIHCSCKSLMQKKKKSSSRRMLSPDRQISRQAPDCQK